jgi:hypothetical protein
MVLCPLMQDLAYPVPTWDSPLRPNVQGAYLEQLATQEIVHCLLFLAVPGGLYCKARRQLLSLQWFLWTQVQNAEPVIYAGVKCKEPLRRADRLYKQNANRGAAGVLGFMLCCELA